MIEHAPAKINVCLFVGPRRADGRHELVTVFQPLTLHDDVELVMAGATDEVICPGVDGPNLAAAAIAAFRARTGWDGPGVRVTITKQIPVAAGMAGGSADAAATLRLLARAAEAVGDDVLLEIAAGLGADVPAQVRPHRQLGTGAGDVLEALDDVDSYGVLVVTSPHQLRTGDVFARARELGSVREPGDLDQRLAEVRAALPSLPGALVVNDLQDAAVDLCPWVGETLARVRDAGADQALVSGSGPTVLGLFADDVALARAAATVGAQVCRTAVADT